MDALMAALVVAAATLFADRTSWLVALLADARGRPGPVLLAAAIALAVTNAVAAAAGGWMAPHLAPNARGLLLGVALILQGGGMLPRLKRPERAAAGGAPGGAAMLFVQLLGGGLAFVVFALAVRTGAPVFAAVGAMLGGAGALAVPAMLGEAGWRALPLDAIRRVVGGLCLLVGGVLALGGLGLI